MRTATLGSVPCLPSKYRQVLIATADRLSGAARLRRGNNSQLQIWNWKKHPLWQGDRAAGRVNQDENAGHDPAIRAAIVVARGPLTSRRLPRWVHRFLPPLRFAARETRSATGRGPPMDYLDNPLPASIAGADHVPPKKCGFRSAFTCERLRRLCCDDSPDSAPSGQGGDGVS